MSNKDSKLVSFLEELMHRRKLIPNKLAADLGISHATVSRWLSGKNIPNIRSCRKLADYSGKSLNKILSYVGYLPQIEETEAATWPEFREYASKKYPNELDEDLITVIEELIERRRRR